MLSCFQQSWCIAFGILYLLSDELTHQVLWHDWIKGSGGGEAEEGSTEVFMGRTTAQDDLQLGGGT